MTINDVSLLGKKVLVGIIVTLIPFIIIFGGLWLTRKLLERSSKTKIAFTIHQKSNRL
jgi:hypothetical protein